MKQLVAVVTLGLLALGPSALAQEHPEHPKKDEKQATVNPDAAGPQLTLDQLADAITAYIERDSKLKGGYFLAYDAEEKKPLVLTLESVHKERLASLGDGIYFACTDMKSTAGTIYDLDFFMKRIAGGIETTEVAIHKKAGKARYGWKEENGVWKKVKG